MKVVLVLAVALPLVVAYEYAPIIRVARSPAPQKHGGKIQRYGGGPGGGYGGGFGGGPGGGYGGGFGGGGHGGGYGGGFGSGGIAARPPQSYIKATSQGSSYGGPSKSSASSESFGFGRR